MKRKGFTLVELLAVIAILGTLILFVAPKVIESLHNVKKKAFITDVQTVYKMAISQAEADSAGKRMQIRYCRINGEACPGFEELDLNGGIDFDYVIDINRDGVVTYYAATNGRYQFAGGSLYQVHWDTKSSNSSVITSIDTIKQGIEDVSEISEDAVVSIEGSGTNNLISIQTIIDNYNSTTGNTGLAIGDIAAKNTYILDLDSYVNGTRYIVDKNAFRANIYINGIKVANSVGDYCLKNVYGSTYRVEYWPINGYTCDGISEASDPLEGVINKRMEIEIVCYK